METKTRATEEEAAKVSKCLKERLSSHDDNRVRLQEELATKVGKLRRELDELEERISTNLQVAFTAEEDRLQEILSKIDQLLAKNEESNVEEELLAAAAEGRTALLVEQTYALEESAHEVRLGDLLELKVNEALDADSVLLRERQPKELRLTGTSGRITAEFHFLSEAERELIEARHVDGSIAYRVSMVDEEEYDDYDDDDDDDDDDDEDEEMATKEKEKDEKTEFLLGYNDRSFFGKQLKDGGKYRVRVRSEWGDGRVSKWSKPAEFVTSFPECCVWRECPRYVGSGGEYVLDPRNARVATKNDSGEDDDDYAYGYAFTTYSTITGNAALPRNGVTSWDIKVVKSWMNNARGVYVGVAPSDVSPLNNENFEKCGWYLDCYRSRLWSGPPHWARAVEYGVRKGEGRYVNTGDVVGVVMDMERGKLSFVIEGVNRGVGVEGIPLDKPLVPCVILEYNGDSVEIIP